MVSPQVLGLTGSIGTGKSTVAKMLKRLKVPVIDADALVHQLYETEPFLIKKLTAYHPSLVHHGNVNRPALRHRLEQDPSFGSFLEKSVHPLVKQALCEGIKRAHDEKHPLVVLEVPLLFEAEMETLCDFILVVHVSDSHQKERVLRRPGMTEDYFLKILARQMPQQQKIKRADFTLDTSKSRVHIFKQLLIYLERICSTHA